MPEVFSALNATSAANLANMTSMLTTTINTTTNMAAAAALAASASAETLDLPGFDLPQNYSILINKLEQLALGLDSALGNFTIDRQEVEIALTNGAGDVADDLLFGASDPGAAGRSPPPHISHGSRVFRDDPEDFAHVVSDIWIGVILTLLIVFVVFFICACFVYHKFQQWKNSYRANHGEPMDMCRRCPPDYEAESLPSYTIVSGLPTYDDALEEFRKAGILLTPSVVPIIKIFECNETAAAKEIYNVEISQPAVAVAAEGNPDTLSLNSATCTCAHNNGAANVVSANAVTAPIHNINLPAFGTAAIGTPLTSQVIELSPEQLAVLSQKRLSLQISFNNSVRSQPRTVAGTMRNNLLRSRAVGNTAGVGPIDTTGAVPFPPIYRSTSARSLANEQRLLDKRLSHLNHRGSLY